MASSLTAWSSALPSVSTSAAKGPSSRRHRQVCYTTPHKVLRFTRRYGRLVCTRAAYSSGHWKPDGGGRRGIWSIRNDLDVPFSPVMQWGDGPSMQLYQRFDSVISQLFQHRIIRCGGPVEDDMANIIVAQLLYLDAMDPHKDIVMYINSPGGSVTAGMAIYDTMKHIHPDVSTVCIGVAASMAAFLLSAGTKGKRFSLPNSRIMIHQPSADTEGSLSEREIQMHEMLHHRAVLGGYLAYNTGQSFEKIDEDSRYDFFMSAEEAVRYGLIDGVLTNPLKAHYPRSESDNQEPVAR